MPLNLEIGDKFPDIALPNDRDQTMSISDVAQGQPLFLAFFRGPW